MTFLDLAFSHVARGLHVVPLKPRDKSPIVSGGCHAASADENQIRAWWTKTPNANVGIGCGNSNKAVLDIDHGLNSLEDFHAWRMRNGLPETYTVMTGRRPEFGIHMYFDGARSDVGPWELDGCSGQVKSLGGLVVAAGSVHPDSGETYQVICDVPCAPTPDKVRQLKTAPNPQVERKSGEKITEGRNNALVSRVGTFRNEIPGVSEDSTLAFMQQWNIEECADPMSCDEVEECVRKQFRLYADVEQLPKVVFGSSKQPELLKDWRERYHSFEEMDSAPEPTFLIEGFLQKDVISSIAAPVGQRKTIIAANVVHAALTGERLFDHFAVTQRPARVLYLCPEMGLLSFTKRMRNLGLMQYVGKTLFCRTMNSEGKLSLSELTPEELAGAIVVVDTAVRFVEGDENSSEHMKAFADACFRLMKDGAASVLVLFHSPKGTKEAPELTLENAMRGSGDLGAFVSSCWATRLQDPDAPWESASYLKNVKQRDFESDPFEVKSDKLGRLHILAAPGANVILAGKRRGPPGDADGREDEALQVIRDNPTLSYLKTSAKLKEMGIDRSPAWVGLKRPDLLKTGVKVTTIT
jgi:hypothetical protein